MKNSSLMDVQVTHSRGGNGWLVVQRLGNEYCKVVQFGVDPKPEIDSRCFLAWKKLLTPSGDIPPQIQPLLDTLRHEIKSGQKAIRDTRIVDA